MSSFSQPTYQVWVQVNHNAYESMNLLTKTFNDLLAKTFLFQQKTRNELTF